MRREVLGADHVDRSLAQASDFSRPIQELVTEYCWGVVWSRDGLERKTRSLLNMAMLTALNRPHEFGAHVRGAWSTAPPRRRYKKRFFRRPSTSGCPRPLSRSASPIRSSRSTRESTRHPSSVVGWAHGRPDGGSARRGRPRGHRL